MNFSKLILNILLLNMYILHDGKIEIRDQCHLLQNLKRADYKDAAERKSLKKCKSNHRYLKKGIEEKIKRIVRL